MAVVLATVGLATIGLGCTAPDTMERTRVFEEPDSGAKVAELESRIAARPDDFASRIKLGRLFLLESMNYGARAQFEQALALAPDDVETRLLLAMALQRLAVPRPTRALALLREATALAPGNADVHLRLGHALLKTEEPEEALREFSSAIELSRDGATVVSAHLGRAQIYETSGLTEKAQQELAAARAIYPGIDDILRQAAIEGKTPTIQIGGAEFGSKDGLHPELEQRADELLKVLHAMAESEHEQ